MTDDQDRCEWVNVLLVSAHPCSPRQNPESHKTVVAVKVVVVTYKCRQKH